MNYDPELSMKFNFEGPEDTAYRICCVWIKHSRTLFPTYMHSKIPQLKNLRKSVLFRTILKLIKERQFKTIEEYEYFIKAQLTLFKKIQQQGLPVLVEPVILTGEPAERRWFYWKKLVAEANKLTKQTYSMQDSDMEYDLIVSLKEIQNICGANLTFETFNSKSSKVRTAAILKKIKPIYFYLSEWVKKLPEEIKKDLYERTDAVSFDKFNVDNAKKIYQDLFAFETNMS
jgi:hypothetical protein